MMQEAHTVRIVVFKEEDMYVAQCLEHDICVQADDIATLQRRFEQTYTLEGEGVRELPAAPDKFQEMWDAGRTLESKMDSAEMRLAA